MEDKRYEKNFKLYERVCKEFSLRDESYFKVSFIDRVVNEIQKDFKSQGFNAVNFEFDFDNCRFWMRGYKEISLQDNTEMKGGY